MKRLLLIVSALVLSSNVFAVKEKNKDLFNNSLGKKTSASRIDALLKEEENERNELLKELVTKDKDNLVKKMSGHLIKSSRNVKSIDEGDLFNESSNKLPDKEKNDFDEENN